MHFISPSVGLCFYFIHILVGFDRGYSMKITYSALNCDILTANHVVHQENVKRTVIISIVFSPRLQTSIHSSQMAAI